ncbi:unnamed protein product [Penicillium manginii]
MCKNVYWHCILCNATIRNSSIPDLCHYATSNGRSHCIRHVLPAEKKEGLAAAVAVAITVAGTIQHQRQHQQL